MKKIFVGLLTLAIALVVLPMFAAFEAHVINVTATIENALSVPLTSINFGTVFPQEQLENTLGITLSQSFKDQDRVNTVDYIIRQKPKCGFTTDNGTVLVGDTKTGEVIVDLSAPNGYRIECGPAPVDGPADGVWGVLPSLCPYLSKHSSNDNDTSIPAFHVPFEIINGEVVWTEAGGTLSNPNQPSVDWMIDLKVPCFGGSCAQDWADFVHGINSDADPAQYTQPISNEHKVFGCDLWVETTGVSGAGPSVD